MSDVARSPPPSMRIGRSAVISPGSTRTVSGAARTCVIGRYHSDNNTFLLKTFGLAGSLDLAGWRLKTGDDLHSS